MFVSDARFLTVHVASDGQGGLVLEQHGLHRSHGRNRHPLIRVLEVGVVPRAMEHGHEPGGHGAVTRVQILQQEGAPSRQKAAKMDAKGPRGAERVGGCGVACWDRKWEVSCKETASSARHEALC